MNINICIFGYPEFYSKFLIEKFKQHNFIVKQDNNNEIFKCNINFEEKGCIMFFLDKKISLIKKECIESPGKIEFGVKICKIKKK